ncbi:hypothetical protein [Methanobrevibacter sp.]
MLMKTNTKEYKNRDDEFYFYCRATMTHQAFSFKNFTPLSLEPDNAATLCHWCHKKHHAFYNLENTNPVTLIKFFKEFGF